MKIYISILAIMLATATFAQNKQPLQQRDNYEFEDEMPRYVEQLKEELTYPMAWGNSPITDFEEWKSETRKKVFECMMAAPRRRDFDMRVVAEEHREGYSISGGSKLCGYTAKKIELWVNAYSRIHAYLLIPDGKGPFPAVNALHDHGAHLYIGKEKMVRPFGVDSAVVADADEWARRLYEGQYLGDYLASHGYVVFSADAPMWGERGRKEGVNRKKYDQIAGNMMMLGRNLSAFMTYDDIATTDFIATLPFVDKEKIGCAGCSMGGYRAWMLAALSDKIKMGAAICWMTTTASQMSTVDKKPENGGFANCIPALRQYLDYPHIASLACPKPMLFVNGKRDHLFPIAGVEDAFATMRDVWRSQGASDKLQTEVFDVPHSCGLALQERILKFFDEAF